MGINTNKQFSPLIPIFILISLIPITWLSINNIQSGSVFFTVALLFIIAVFGTIIFNKENKLKIIEPFQTTFTKSAIAFTIIALIPIALFFLPGLFGAKSILTAQSFIPLSASKIVEETTSTSFSTLSAELDPGNRLLTITLFAPTWEELTFGWGITIFIFAIASQIFKEKKIFPAITAILISSILFTLVHQLNGDYLANPSAFLFAFIFRLIMNTIILFNPTIGLAGTLGFHWANNFIWYLNKLGIVETFIGISTPIGIITYSFIGFIMVFSFVQIFRGKFNLIDFLKFEI